MSRETKQLWDTLTQAGVVQGLVPEAGRLESPWYVKVLLAFSGWLAALFLLGFIGVGFQFIIKSSAASFFTGGAMIFGAFALLRAPKNEFFEHLSLAISLAGQALIILSIFKIFKGDNETTWMLIAFLQVILAIIMPNFVHRVYSTFIAAFAFSTALTIWGAPYIFSGIVMLLACWFWINEFRFPQHMSKMRAIGYGLVLALIQLKGSGLFSTVTMGWYTTRNQAAVWVQPWMGEVLAGAVTLYIVWQLLNRSGHFVSRNLSIMAILGTLLLCAASMKAQGITVGIVVILLGFAGSNRVLLGLGITSFLFYISAYYYLLDATLLAKSQTLFIVGLILLTLRWIMVPIISRDQEAKHA